MSGYSPADWDSFFVAIVGAAAALTGGTPWAWLPNLLLWAALVLGAIGGALAYGWINLTAVWFAAGWALTLSGIVFATTKRD